MVGAGLIAAIVVVAVVLLLPDPRVAQSMAEYEEDLRWEKAQRERERRDFERKILGE